MAPLTQEHNAERRQQLEELEAALAEMHRRLEVHTHRLGPAVQAHGAVLYAEPNVFGGHFVNDPLNSDADREGLHIADAMERNPHSIAELNPRLDEEALTELRAKTLELIAHRREMKQIAHDAAEAASAVTHSLRGDGDLEAAYQSAVHKFARLDLKERGATERYNHVNEEFAQNYPQVSEQIRASHPRPSSLPNREASAFERERNARILAQQTRDRRRGHGGHEH